MVSASTALVPTVRATAAGTPALAIPANNSRRVMATLVLFLIDLLSRRSLQLFRVCAVDFDARHASLLAALETLGGDPGCAPDGPRHHAHQGRCANFDSSRSAINRWVGIGRSRQMNRHGFEGTHSPDHAFFGAAGARSSDADRPHAGNLIEMSSGTRGVSDWSLTA